MSGKLLTHERGPLYLALLVLAVFCLGIGGDFVYDDQLLISKNLYVHGFEYLPRAFTTHFWDVAGSDHWATLHYYRPLITLSYLWDWQLGGGAPWAFHLTNALLHATAVWLAGRLCRRVLPGSKLWLLPALLFALHPTRIESVLWISGRTDVLLSVWCLLALEAAAKFSRAGTSGARVGALVATGVFSAAALLSKEVALLLPLLLLAQMLALPKSNAPANAFVRHAQLWLCLALCLVYVALRVAWLPIGTPGLELTPLSFLAAIEGYAQRLLLPWPQSFFLQPLVLGDAGFVQPTWRVVVGALVLTGSLVFGVAAWRQNRAAFIWLLCAAAGLAPLLHLIGTGLPFLVADRFWYLPLLFLALGCSMLYRQPLERWLDRPNSPVLLAAVSVLMVAVLLLSLPRFHRGSALWEDELALDPCAPIAHDHLAQLAAGSGELELAQRHLARVLSKDCVSQALVHQQLPLTAYSRLLILEAARTADGDRSKLAHLYTRLSALYAGKPTPSPAVPGLREPDASFFQRIGQDPRALPAPADVAAELAGLATRLGKDGDARRWLARIPAGDERKISSPPNLVLTLARLGRFAEAQELVQSLLRRPDPLISKARAQELTGRIADAKSLERQATSRPRFEAAALRAQSMAGLGAYGRALQILKPAYDEHPQPALVVLYAQLLVAARLERQALRVIERSETPERARQIVTNIRQGLAPELVSIPPVGTTTP